MLERLERHPIGRRVPTSAVHTNAVGARASSSEHGQRNRVVQYRLHPDLPRRSIEARLNFADIADRLIGSTRDHPGYGIRVADAEVDFCCFGRLTTVAREDLRTGRFDVAATGFSEALALWRGPAGEDLPRTSRLVAFATWLNMEHAAVVEDRAYATLGARRYRDAVGELERFVVDHPTRETAWLLLACAYYLDGDAACAQTTIRRAYQALDDAVGLDVGLSLKAAEHAVIHRDEGWFRERIARPCVPSVP